ncbi:MAG: tetratricopeptide repeat protein, partial [Fervidicoccaceae archaeon]
LTQDCFNYIKAQDYQRALRSGLEAVRIYPNSVDANLCVGESYRDLGQYNQAIKYLKTAEKYAASKSDLNLIYNFEGTVYGNLGDYNNALLYANRALSLDIELGDKDIESTNLSNIAYIYQNLGDLDKALEYYKKSLAISNEKDKAAIYNNIGSIYYYKNEYDQAIDYFKKAIAISQRFG